MTDLMTLASSSKKWQSSASAVASGMNGLGIEPDFMRTATAALQIFTGTAQAVAVAQSVISLLKARTAIEATAHTVAKVASGPVGWATIGAALAVAVGVGAAFGHFAAQHNIQANLDNPSEVKMVAGLSRGA
jgi:hypothetical protein